MFAVCLGIYCQKKTKNKDKLHCDSSRSNFQKKFKDKKAEEKNEILETYHPLLSISPLNKVQMNQIGFTRQGVFYYKKPSFDIKSESDNDKNIRYDLNKVLNLNCENLIENRKKVSESVHSSLRRHNYNKKFAKKELEYWEQKNGSYKAFCQVAIFELRKYI